MLLFFHAIRIVNQLRIKKKLTVAVQYKVGNSIALLAQRVMKAWTAVRKRGGLESWKSVVQPYLF